jgi:hypothetical protein
MITSSSIGGYILNQPKDKPQYSGLSSQYKKEQPIVTPIGKFYEIRIKGQLSELWADWFEGMTVKYLENEEMLLCGFIVDQSALMGILNKLARVNLTLISLNEIDQTEKK